MYAEATAFSHVSGCSVAVLFRGACKGSRLPRGSADVISERCAGDARGIGATINNGIVPFLARKSPHGRARPISSGSWSIRADSRPIDPRLRRACAWPADHEHGLPNRIGCAPIDGTRTGSSSTDCATPVHPTRDSSSRSRTPTWRHRIRHRRRDPRMPWEPRSAPRRVH